MGRFHVRHIRVDPLERFVRAARRIRRARIPSGVVAVALGVAHDDTDGESLAVQANGFNVENEIQWGIHGIGINALSVA
jgi:hypothetical protein